MANASDSDSDDWEFESLRAGQEKSRLVLLFYFLEEIRTGQSRKG